MTIELETEDSMQYRFYPVQSKALKLSIKAPHDAHIALASGPSDANPIYEIFIGGWENTKIAIRRNREKPDVVELPSPDVLNNDVFKNFWITFHSKTISMGIDEGQPLVQWPDPDLFEITHFGVRTSWGAKGVWKIDDTWTDNQSSIGWNVSTPSDRIWLPANDGAIPPNAVQGGFDNEPIIIGRATHEGALLPGKILPSHRVCYVAWGGKEHGIPNYEVLCGPPANWLPTTGDAVPPTAIPGGKTEDGESLYIGRVNHEGAETIGKVQRSHGVCYIPFGGLEVPYREYEILVE